MEWRMEDASRLFGTGFTYFFDLMAIELRNMEALGLAQQKMLEGMGVLAQRQAEIVDGTIRRSLDARPSTNGPTSPIDLAINQIGSLKTTMQESQANSNVLSELAARSSGEVANILQSRMMAALDEFKAALEKAVPEKPAAMPAALVHQPSAPQLSTPA
jgi:phasin protein